MKKSVDEVAFNLGRLVDLRARMADGDLEPTGDFLTIAYNHINDIAELAMLAINAGLAKEKECTSPKSE